MRPAIKTNAAPNALTETLPRRLIEGYGLKILEKISPITRNFSRLSSRRLAQSRRQKFSAETNGATSAPKTAKSPKAPKIANARKAGISRESPRFQMRNAIAKRNRLGATQR